MVGSGSYAILEQQLCLCIADAKCQLNTVDCDFMLAGKNWIVSLPAPEDYAGRICFPEPISGNNSQEKNRVKLYVLIIIL